MGLPHLRRTSANTPPHPPSNPEAGPSSRRGKLRLGKCEPFAQRARLLRDSRTSAVSTILNVWDGNPGSGSHTQSHPSPPPPAEGPSQHLKEGFMKQAKVDSELPPYSPLLPPLPAMTWDK